MRAMPIAAHCVSEYLHFGSNWIHALIGGLRRYRPVVLCKRTVNLPYFSLDAAGGEVVAAYSSAIGHAYQKAARSWFTPHYPAFFRAIERRHVALLHSHLTSSGYNDLPLKRRFGLPHVVSAYGADIWKLGMLEEWRQKYAVMFRESEALLAEGNAMREKIIALGCPSDKVRILHLGVDLAKVRLIPRQPGDDGVIRCLMACRAIEKKGLIYGLHAFANVAQRHRNLRLDMILCGESKGCLRLIREIKSAAAERGIANSITWYGAQRYDDYLRIAERAHLYLAPSVHAANGDAEGGCPMAVIELSAAGMPVLSSRHCDIAEAVLDGVSGYLAPEKDVDALTDRLEFLVTHPEKWPQMGRAGRAHVEAEYNAALQPGRLENLYDELL
jgi:colanic acid/amylovoran biosynthesis glycosyltransferase